MSFGWIKIEKGYVTSCGHRAMYHRAYIYCPFCGKHINITKERKNEHI